MNKFHQQSSLQTCLLGVGYIGLPTALLIAQAGMRVHAYDVDASKISKLSIQLTSICENDVIQLLRQSAEWKHLVFDAKAPIPADFFLLAVPTPFLASKDPDLSAVWSAVYAIENLIKKGDVVILESTVPVGSTDKVAAYLAEKTGLIVGVDFFVAYCPERVLPGNMLHELVTNDRVIGGVTPACALKAQEFYRYFVQGDLVCTTAPIAEMVKLVENSSRDIQIAFAHELDYMCREAGMDSYEVINLANRHPRVNILKPSAGVGGHCIAVDPWFLIKRFPKVRLMPAARQINDERPSYLVNLIKQAIEERFSDINVTPTIGLWGLSFKPNVDDMRHSPALEIAQLLVQELPNIDIHVVEPHVSSNELLRYGFSVETDLYASLDRADVIIPLVNHAIFSTIEYQLLSHKILLDVCGLLAGLYANKLKKMQIRESAQPVAGGV